VSVCHLSMGAHSRGGVGMRKEACSNPPNGLVGFKSSWNKPIWLVPTTSKGEANGMANEEKTWIWAKWQEISQ